MAESRVTLKQLFDVLGERAKHHHERNLVLVALPLETAHNNAAELAEALGAEFEPIEGGGHENIPIGKIVKKEINRADEDEEENQ